MNSPELLITAQRPEAEAIRRKLVNIIILIYLLLIIEGAIRKWVFPQFAEYIFFIRVPVTLWLYFQALRYHSWPRAHKYFGYGMLMAAFGLLLIPIQIVLGNYGTEYMVIAGYGWINYYFYIPLAFIAAEQIRTHNLGSIIKITLVLAIIVAPLTVLQLYSPADSPLVTGFGDGELHSFTGIGFGGALIRPMGLFTSAVGQQMFTVSVLAFVMFAWVNRSTQISLPVFIRLAATVSVTVLVGISMHRGTLVHLGIVIAFLIAGGMSTMRRRVVFRSVVYPIILCIVGAVLFITYFFDAYEMFSARWLGGFEYGSSEQIAYGSAGIFGRAVYETTRFISLLDVVPITGHLLGIAGNAAAQLPWVELPVWAQSWVGNVGWAEDGLSRNIVELGPVFGLLFILYRYTFFFWLLKKSYYVARRKGDLLPIILVGFVGPLLIYHQMTGHGTIIGYTWMFIGFCMAAIRETENKWTAKNVTLSRRAYYL